MASVGQELCGSCWFLFYNICEMEDLEVGDWNHLTSHYSCLALNINRSLGTSVPLCGLSEWTNFIFFIAWCLDSKRGYPEKAWARWQLNCFWWPKTDSHIVLFLPYSTSQDTHKVLPSSKTPLLVGGVVIWEEIRRVYRTRNNVVAILEKTGEI